MSVRRIPLHKHQYLSKDGEIDVDDESRPEDADTILFLEKIRKKLLTDRALYDQV